MKNIATVLAATALAMTVAATSFARESTAPGQQCAGLSPAAKRSCMRGVIMIKHGRNMQHQAERKFSKRNIKQLERIRQHSGMMHHEVQPLPPPSSAATSSSAGSATSGTSSSY